MQTDRFSCGRKSPAVVTDEMDGGGETEMREVKEVPDQLETIGVELQQAEGVIGQSTASGTEKLIENTTLSQTELKHSQTILR